MTEKSGVPRRAFNQLIAFSGLYLGAYWLKRKIPESTNLFSDSPLKREMPQDTSNVETIEYEKVLETLEQLCDKEKVRIGKNEDGSIMFNSSLSSDVNISTSDTHWNTLIQSHAKTCYLAREHKGKKLSYESYYLERYLPEVVKILGRNNISLDTYIAWAIAAQGVYDYSGTGEGYSIGYKKDIYQAYGQNILAFGTVLEKLIMGSSPISDSIRATDYEHNPIQSAYDAPRMYVITELMSDLEWERIVDGWDNLDNQTKTEIRSNHPDIYYALRRYGLSREDVLFSKDKLMQRIKDYLVEQEGEGIVDKMLSDKQNPYWDNLGWGENPKHSTRNYLSTNYNSVWEKTVLQMKQVNGEIDQHQAATIAMSEVKSELIQAFREDKDTARMELVNILLDYPLFMRLLRKDSINKPWEGAAKSLDLESTILESQILEMRRYKGNLAKLVHTEEYNEKLQLGLFLGVINETLVRAKNSQVINQLTEVPAGEVLVSMWDREVAPMHMQAETSRVFKNKLFDISSETKEVYDVMNIIVMKVNELAHPYQLIDLAKLVSLVIDQIYSGENNMIEPGSVLEFMKTTEWTDDPKIQLAISRLGKPNKDLGSTINVSSNMFAYLYGSKLQVVTVKD